MKKIILLCVCFLIAGILAADTYVVLVDVKDSDYQSKKAIYDGAFTNLFSDSKAAWRTIGKVESNDRTKDLHWYQLPDKLIGVNTVLLNRIITGQIMAPGFQLVEVKTDIQPWGTNILIKVKKRSRSSNTNAIQQVL